jgi:type VI secretion system protein ImpG
VHSIDEVVATSSDHRTMVFSPFYSLTHHRASDADSAQFWHASRRPESLESTDRTDVFVSLVDSHFAPHLAVDWTVDVVATCLNPRQLPFGGGQPRFQLESGGPLQPTACLVPPTKTLRPFQTSSVLWRLVSHLTLNHLSLVSPDASAEPLREILKLCDMADSDETRNLIKGLLSVRAERSVARPAGRTAVVCRGLDIALHFDEGRFAGNGLFLMGAVLERFLGMYASINSFTRTTITTSRRDRELCRWPARAGATVLL